MNKKTLIAVAISALAFGGIIASAVGANSGGWDNVMATDVKSENGMTVKRLAFGKDAIGPVQMGSYVVVGEPIVGPSETRYNLTILRDGMQKVVANVPKYALDANRFVKNGDRLVYANRVKDNDNRWTVLEVNLDTGEQTVLASDVFINNASDVEVMVEGKSVFFQAEYDFTDKAYKQAAALIWVPEESKAVPVTAHWALNREEIQDVRNGVLLVKMVFASGDREYWLMDSAIVNYSRGSMKPVPGTWTSPPADLVAGHFTKDGTVEYFQYFTRHTYQPGVNELPVEYASEHLSWYKPLGEAFRMAGDTLTWLDPQDTAYVSNGGKVLSAGTKNGLTASASGNGVRTYMRKNDAIYEMTSLPAPEKTALGARVMRTQADATVYLIRNGKRYAMPSETVYLSYFRDWTPVEMVSYNELNSYPLEGLARFAPGTKLKAFNEAKVYVVGRDGKLHWIQNQELAFQVYGPTWNRGILEVVPSVLFDYQTGDTVQLASDMDKI